ncbi:MAG: type II toxin-antitoxin system HicA family toxin [Planctomycetes bacterium]|nr:type II toxin-antitoxin system HicA family toxin [Planctomycetota bacterium]
MSRTKRVLQAVVGGTSDAGIRFGDRRRLLKALGFEERTRGDHHIFTHEGVVEIVNLQPRGSLAKPYQVKQVRQLVFKYRLGLHS